MTDTPPSILDRIDLQLVAGSDEVVLTRAEAEILACLLSACSTATEITSPTDPNRYERTTRNDHRNHH